MSERSMSATDAIRIVESMADRGRDLLVKEQSWAVTLLRVAALRVVLDIAKQHTPRPDDA